MRGWPLLPDGTISAKLRRAESLNHQAYRVRIVSEVVFLELAGRVRQPDPLAEGHTEDQVGRLLGIDTTTLRRWEQFGLVRARGGRFDFQDLVSLQTILELLGRGIRLETIGQSIRGLSKVLPGTDRPLAQLKIVAANVKKLLA